MAFSQLQLKCFGFDRAFGPIELIGQFQGRHVRIELGKQLQIIFGPVAVDICLHPHIVRFLSHRSQRPFEPLGYHLDVAMRVQFLK